MQFNYNFRFCSSLKVSQSAVQKLQRSYSISRNLQVTIQPHEYLKHVSVFVLDNFSHLIPYVERLCSHSFNFVKFQSCERKVRFYSATCNFEEVVWSTYLCMLVARHLMSFILWTKNTPCLYLQKQGYNNIYIQTALAYIGYRSGLVKTSMGILAFPVAKSGSYIHTHVKLDGMIGPMNTKKKAEKGRNVSMVVSSLWVTLVMQVETEAVSRLR